MVRRREAKEKVTKREIAKSEIPIGFKLRRVLQGHTRLINWIAWSRDGRWIASASLDGTIRLWDSQRGTTIYTFPGMVGREAPVALSPNGLTLACVSISGILRIWDVRTGQDRKLQARVTNPIKSLEWSTDGRTLAVGTCIGGVELLDVEKGIVKKILSGYDSMHPIIHYSADLSWSPREQKIVVGSCDGMLRIWDIRKNKIVKSHEGHKMNILSTAWAPQGDLLASGSRDRTIAIWKPATAEKINVLEGHTNCVQSVSFSADGSLLASKSDDGTVQIWSREDWQQVAQLPECKGHGIQSGIAFHPIDPQILATLGEDENKVRIWDLDTNQFRRAMPQIRQVYYSNAKVVLVGDTGVGKTGLGLVLSKNKWEPTASTHGRQIWSIEEKTIPLDSGKEITREILLWDLAGQPGYRLIHQLSLTEVAVALVIFDARSETEPFAGVAHWNKALCRAQAAYGESKVCLKKYLVAARVDRGGVSASRTRIQRVIEKYGFDAFFETSAMEGTNIAQLAREIKAAIEWENLPTVSSNELFQNIKKFLLHEKWEGRLICSVENLYYEYLKIGRIPDACRGRDLKDEFRTCIVLLDGRGLIRQLNFGGLVLLQPELLDAYAASLINAAKAEPDGLGCIAEEDARAGIFSIPEGERIDDSEQENLLLIAMVEDLLRHEIALREEGDLVFPSQFTRQNPDMPDLKGKDIVFHFEGPVMNIYATLVVRLVHSEMFTLRSKDMWQHAAIFGTSGTGRCGVALMGDIDEGLGNLTLFYQNEVDEVIRAQFEKFVDSHLSKRALPGKIQKRRIIVCSKCETTMSNEQVEKAKERARTEIICPVCEEKVSLRKRPVTVTVLGIEEMERQADAGRDRAVAISVIEGKLATNDFDVFLCHNSEDKPAVKKIGQQLMELGILPWLDEWNLRPGIPWQDVLEKQIESINNTAVFIGPDGLGPWQNQEQKAFLRQFVKRNCPVIPVILPGCEKVPKIPVFLETFTWVDFRKSEPDPMEQLIWGITGEKREAK